MPRETVNDLASFNTEARSKNMKVEVPRSQQQITQIIWLKTAKATVWSSAKSLKVGLKCKQFIYFRSDFPIRRVSRS